MNESVVMNKLDRAKLHLEQLRQQLNKRPRPDDIAVQSTFAAFLEAIYALDEQLGKLVGKAQLHAAKGRLDNENRRFLQSMTSKRGSNTHEGHLRVSSKEKMIRAEEFPGVSVVGPLLSITEEESRVAEEVGMKPGWLAGVVVPEYYVVFKKRKDVEVSEVCQRCLAIYEQLFSQLFP